MSSHAAKVALICALVFVWVGSCGQLRKFSVGDRITTSWTEIDDIKELHNCQHHCILEMASCTAVELAPDFVVLAETTAQGADTMFRVSVSKRGPPNVGF